MPGTFIVLEGPDGAGKSTQAKRLAATLEARGVHVVRVREPGGTVIGERVRGLLLGFDDDDMDPRAELLLFMASRAQLVREVIRPALDSGWVVIADRFLASSAVYQGVAGGLGIEAVLEIGKFATGGLAPDLTIYLDLPAEVGLERLAAARPKDRFEQKSIEFHRQVVEGYARYFEIAKERVEKVDATRDEAAVAEEVARVCGGVIESSSR